MNPPHSPTRVPPRPAPEHRWADRATCNTDPDPNRWIDLPPVRTRGKNNPAYDDHKATLASVCATCPVFNQCLWAALDQDVRGVFAGTDEFDRADLREALNLPTPPRIPAPENAEDARLIEQQFTALRLARKNYTNTEIADLLGVSPMTISRITSAEERPALRRTKHAPATTTRPATADHTALRFYDSALTADFDPNTPPDTTIPTTATRTTTRRTRKTPAATPA